MTDPRPSNAHLGASLLVTLGSTAFAINQNRGTVVGGRIHWAKAAWLNLALLTFLVLPGAWWRSSTAGPHVRRALGATAGSFVVRGVAELVLVYMKPPRWKCGYGIGHDAVAFAALAVMLLRAKPHLKAERDGRALAFSGFTLVLLLIEIVFAKRFRAVQDPATGIYFADDSPQFRAIIRMTKAVVFVGYPVLALLLASSRRDFVRGARHDR